MSDYAPRVLAVETSTSQACCALIDQDGTLLAEFSFRARRTMAQRLAPALTELLAQVDLGPEAIEALAVGLGPGSFTSLRVGLSMAKGIAVARGLPVVGVSSLAALAAGVPLTERRPVCAVIVAPKRQVYAELHARMPGEITNRLFGPELLDLAELAERLRGVGYPVEIVGGLGEAERAALASPDISFSAPCHAWPRAVMVAQLARRRLLAGDHDDLASLTPLYVTPSEPEVRLGQTFARPGNADVGRDA